MNYQKVYMNQVYSSSLMGQVSQMWKDDILCDAVIKTGQVQTKAHRLVMIAACPMLQTMENASLGSHLEVRLSAEIKKESVLAFLQYLYEGFMMLTEENCRDVEKIGKLLHVDSVVKCCKDFFKCLSEKIGSGGAGKSSFDTEVSTDFRHVRTSSLQKMVQETAFKRAGSEELSTGSPIAKRKRAHRSETPTRILRASDSQLSSHGYFDNVQSGQSEGDSLEVISSDCQDRDSEGWPKQSDAPPIQRSTLAFSVTKQSSGEKDLRVVNVQGADAHEARSNTTSTTANESHVSDNASHSAQPLEGVSLLSPVLRGQPSQGHSRVPPSTSNPQGKSFAAGSALQTSVSASPSGQKVTRSEVKSGSLPTGSEVRSGSLTKKGGQKLAADTSQLTGGKPNADRMSHESSPMGSSRNPDITIVKVEHDASALEMSVDNDSHHASFSMEEGDNGSEAEGSMGEGSRDDTDNDLSSPWQDQGLDGYGGIKYDPAAPTLQCKKCGEIFDDGNDLVHHLRTVEKRKFCEMCKICGEVFFLSRTYRYHLQVKHDISTNCPQCYICGSYFQDNYNLRRHVAIHSLERMFTCSKCGGKFKQRHSMRQHEKNCKGGKISDTAAKFDEVEDDNSASGSPEKKM